MTLNKMTWIKTHEDFCQFLKQFLADYRENHWENNDLEGFLEAMQGWVEDADGFYDNTNQSHLIKNPTWQTFADILMASRIYE